MHLISFVLALGLYGPDDPSPLPLSLAAEEVRAPQVDFPSIEVPQDFQEGPKRDKGDGFGMSAGVRGRYSLPFGSADRDVLVSTVGGGATVLINGNLSWSELFHGGFGTTLYLDIIISGLMEGGRPSSMGYSRDAISGGIYVALEHDEFSGGNATDDLGNRISPDNLTLTTWIVGMLFRQQAAQGFYGEGRVGIGAVHYSAVDADFHLIGVPDFRGSFFEDTWTFAFETRLAGGIRLGPVGLNLGIGFRLLMPPNEGSNVSMSSGPIYTFDIELGAEIGF